MVGLRHCVRIVNPGSSTQEPTLSTVPGVRDKCFGSLRHHADKGGSQSVRDSASALCIAKCTTSGGATNSYDVTHALLPSFSRGLKSYVSASTDRRGTGMQLAADGNQLVAYLLLKAAEKTYEHFSPHLIFSASTVFAEADFSIGSFLLSCRAPKTD